MTSRTPGLAGERATPEDTTMPLEIRLHGRGGQGGVTCAKILAATYARLGKSVSAPPVRPHVLGRDPHPGGVRVPRTNAA